MQKKLKQRKYMIFGISVLIAFMIASMLSGKEVKQPLVIVTKEIDVTKTLGEQIENFAVIPVSQNESAKLGDSVVRNLNELKDARIAIPLTPGSPIPKALLASKKTGGDLALETPEYRTWYRFVGGINMLPPGVAEGDLIDISLLYLDQTGTGNNILTLIMKNVEVSMTNEVDVYVKVPQEDFEKLTVLAGMGTFILQLPGQKEAMKCEELNVEEREGSDCYYESYKPGNISAEDIKKMILEGKSLVKEPEVVIPKKEEIIVPVVPAEETSVINEQGNDDGSIFDETNEGETPDESISEDTEAQKQIEERKKKDSLVQDFFRN